MRDAPRFQLIASSDDFLLEQGLAEAVAAAADALGGAEAEELAEDATPESVALELRSPSLFAPRRLLVLPEVRSWLDATAPPGAGRAAPAPDLGPLTALLEEGLDDSVALVLGAWCGREPKGPLAKQAAAAGGLRWIPLPPPPKPWDEVAVSAEQAQVLQRVVDRASGDVRFERDAVRLLLERLGFAPRLLDQEVRKLATASGGATVDEDLVRRLVFPRERSLEVVRDALLDRDPRPVADLLAVARAGLIVRDWRGQAIEADRVATIVVTQLSGLVAQLLYLRRAAAAAGLGDELRPGLRREPRFYGRRFKGGLAPRLEAFLDRDAPSPLRPASGKPVSTWILGQLFAGAAEYEDVELTDSLAHLGEVEAAQRGPLGPEAVAAWSARFLGRES